MRNRARALKAAQTNSEMMFALRMKVSERVTAAVPEKRGGFQRIGESKDVLSKDVLRGQSVSA